MYYTYEFIQEPCQYIQTYDVTLENEQPLPEFIRFSTTEPSISIYTLNQTDEGEYNIIVTAIIEDQYRSTNSFRFTLTAIFDPQDYLTLQNTAPFFQVVPTDQTFRFGEAWSYELGPAYDLENDNIQVAITYEGIIGSLVLYQEDNNRFSTAASSTGPGDLGTSKVIITLSDDNESGVKSTEYEFLVTIVDNPDWLSPEDKAKLEDIENEPSDFEQFD